jgi:glutamate-1-semialdehyde aminotransferase
MENSQGWRIFNYASDYTKQKLMENQNLMTSMEQLTKELKTHFNQILHKKEEIISVISDYTLVFFMNIKTAEKSRCASRISND